MSEIISLLSDILCTSEDNIELVNVLKSGLTNSSYLFQHDYKKYIFRCPGKGSKYLINRYQEADVYRKISSANISDKVVYIDPVKGYKITEYIEGARACNPHNVSDVVKCMQKLKNFHELKLEVRHEFDLFECINFYESLRKGNVSEYADYDMVKQNVLSLKSYIEKNVHHICLSHIDAIPDNFLIINNQEVCIIDWEYAAMQDPHVDIAMFAIYSGYNKEEVDRLIDIYFSGICNKYIRTKIYAYVSVCGLLWSNWCEYKHTLGANFGDYAKTQYEYAKGYYDIARKEIESYE